MSNPTILNIETSTKTCSVCISKGRKLIAIREKFDVFSHASLITVFIDQLCKEANISIKDIDAVAVSIGPGSYTGLRIGLSIAKGICYSSGKPLIKVPTLRALANAMIKKNPGGDIYLPNIDARRDDLFIAGFNSREKQILEENCYTINEKLLHLFRVYECCFVSGTATHKLISKNNVVNFLEMNDVYISSKNMIDISYKQFHEEQFIDVAYSVPAYLKPVYLKQKSKFKK